MGISQLQGVAVIEDFSSVCTPARDSDVQIFIYMESLYIPIWKNEIYKTALRTK